MAGSFLVAKRKLGDKATGINYGKCLYVYFIECVTFNGIYVVCNSPVYWLTLLLLQYR